MIRVSFPACWLPCRARDSESEVPHGFHLGRGRARYVLLSCAGLPAKGRESIKHVCKGLWWHRSAESTPSFLATETQAMGGLGVAGGAGS